MQWLRLVPSRLTQHVSLHFDPCDLEKYVKREVNQSVGGFM